MYKLKFRGDICYSYNYNYNYGDGYADDGDADADADGIEEMEREGVGKGEECDLFGVVVLPDVDVDFLVYNYDSYCDCYYT